MEEEGGASAAAAVAASSGSGSGSGGGSSGGGGSGTLAALRPGEGALDMYVHLLTASHWPTYPPSAGVRLAPDMAAAGAAFERFYTSKYSSRRLTWVTQVGTCILRAAFPSGRKELDVSLHQALVLLQYNGSSAACEYGALARATGIEAGELKRTLQSLSLGVVRVLRKEPKGKDVAEGDVFTFNAAFAHALTRIKINQIQIKETKAEADATHEKVFQERQYQVDAAVVRIMKARKVLSHTLLMGSIMEQLRFDCAAADIKTRIESLIDREYLERDPQSPSTYHYVA
jgi:cullin-4